MVIYTTYLLMMIAFFFRLNTAFGTQSTYTAQFKAQI